MEMSPATAMKALRIQGSGRVIEVQAARVFQVKGDGGSTYTVVIADDVIACGCPAHGLCKHVAAAGIQIRAEEAADTAKEGSTR